jgi:hypothetical protein
MSRPNDDLIHPHMRESFRHYIEQGVPPGSFMSALLSNDLRETFGRADEINCREIRHYVTWLYNQAPHQCWGSPEAVEAWVEAHAERRKMEAL